MSRFAVRWLIASALVLPVLVRAQDPVPPPADTSVKAVIASAAAYVKNYQEALKFVLSDEVTVQDVLNRAGRRVAHRETSGEFFLTFLPTEGGWVGVRDIALVDGVPVDKRDNLREVLTKASFARIGRQLADRNARYNIGAIARNFNDPMLALVILDDKDRERFKFERRRVVPSATAVLVTVTFTERDAPTLVRGGDGSQIFAKGELVIDAVSGRVVKADITLKDGDTTGTLTTVFTANEKLGLWLPATLTEKYNHRTNRVEETVMAHSTYTNYRRFNVNVTIK